jgi:hypothetical protein
VLLEAHFGKVLLESNYRGYVERVLLESSLREGIGERTLRGCFLGAVGG